MQARTSNLVCIGGAVTHSGVVQAHENVPTVEQLRWLHNSRRESFAARCSAQLSSTWPSLLVAHRVTTLYIGV